MDVRTLHSEAMDLAEKAMIDRARGKLDVAQKHVLQALKKEERAARLAVQNGAPEPTRSVLLKSAAHLAVDAGELRLAEQLVAIALAGDPPEEIASELRCLFEEVGFHRHLELRGIELHSNDLQMVLVGSAIAPGMAASDEFVKRVETMQSLFYRTSESDQDIEYRDRGDPKHEIGNPLQMFVSVPRAASFAVSLKVASEKGQGELDFAESSVVVDTLLERLAMFEQADYEALKREIPKKEYFDNFVKLASDLAPDGDRVRMVGLTTKRGAVEKRLQMKRPPTAQERTTSFVASNKPVRIYGRVFFINTKDQENPVIKLEAEDGTDFRLKAEGDLLQKAVSYAATGSRVSVRGVQTAKTVLHVEEFKATRGRKPGTTSAKRRSRIT